MRNRSYYVWRVGPGSQSWYDYLQFESFEESIRGEMRSSTRELIATREQLAREHIRVTESLASNLSTGLQRLSSNLSAEIEELSFDLKRVQHGISTLNSTFEWGFSEVLTTIGHVADSLNDLILIAKNPAKNWNYEHFEDAREAYRKGLYTEAIDSLNKAIDGYGDHTGYKLEYRFHQWLGIIRMGSFLNRSPDVVQLPEAKKAFLNAARYSRHDYPKEAALAYLAAGRAAYCQGEMQEARTYSQQAISLDASLGEAHFQLAKVLMHDNDVEAGLEALKQAIQIDYKYTTKWSADADFHPHSIKIDALVASLREDAKQLVNEKLTDLEANILFLEQLRTEKLPLANREPIDSIKGLARTIRFAADTATYYGYLEALDLCRSKETAVEKAQEALRNAHQARQNENNRRQAELSRQAHEQRTKIKLEQEARAYQDLADRITRTEKAARKATIAICLSIGGAFCLAIPSIAGLFLGIIALSDLLRCDNSEVRNKTDFEWAKAKAVIAIIVGGALTALLAIGVLSATLESIGRR